MRIEKDSLGEKEVDAAALYGIHTTRSLENFNVIGQCLPLEIIKAVVTLKLACSRANKKLGLLDEPKQAAIEEACTEITTGDYDDQFPIDVCQAGSGTSSNMNVNEVIANLAAEKLGGTRGEKLVHPNDDVNRGQSTNNVIPSAIKVASYELSEKLVEALDSLVKKFKHKSEEFSSIIKSGRTHLQDAVPVTLGQEFGAYARALEKDIYRIKRAQSTIEELGVGGNAVGTGLNTTPAFRDEVISALNEITKKRFRQAENGIESTQFLTDIGELSSAYALFALNLQKITNDLRLLSSGPNTGIGEISLPAVEPGSSIMPGKINPSILEAANMACMQVQGNNHVIMLACGAGQLELNTHMPVIGFHIIQAANILIRCCTMLEKKCISGITAQVDVCRIHFEESAGLATVLNPILGYDRVAVLVKESLKEKKTLRQLVLEKELMTEESFDSLIKGSTKPNL